MNKGMIQQRIIRTQHNEIWLDEEGILWIQTLPDAEIDLEEAIVCFDAYRELGIENNHVLQIMIVGDGFSVNSEARQYISEHGKRFFLASAAVSKSLAVRLLVNFFNMFYRHEVPFKLFGTQEEALNWLSKFKK
jgi:hypothetical protein